MYQEKFYRIENLFNQLNTELDIQIKARFKNYSKKHWLIRLFLSDRNIEKDFEILQEQTFKIHQLILQPNNRQELAAELNLYALNSAILAATLDNKRLAEKAEELRKLSNEIRVT